jgi:competence protein ComGC
MKIRLCGERGFRVLELLVIIVIVCVVIAIGVPTLHSRARAAVLDANMRALASMVSSQVLEGYSTTFNPLANGSADYYLNDHLAMALRTAGKASFVNPYVGSSQGHSIITATCCPRILWSSRLQSW